MSDLRPNLFDTDFEKLVELGRSLIPKYAREWTDHNLHDPGIMLIELLAWTAEAQIYSLGRLRSDERWAYGALLGLTPRGPLPAQGMVWWRKSDQGPPWGKKGVVLPAEAEVTANQPQAPKFRLSQNINLTAAELKSVESRLHDGQVLNHTATNDRDGATYDPFGEQAEEDDRLVLTFEGPLLAADPKVQDAFLSFGVRVPSESTATSTPAPTSEDDLVDAALRSPAATRIVATLLVDGQFRYPLPVQADDTNGFLRTGTILLSLSKVPPNLGQNFAIEFASRDAGLVGPPRISCIKPNVLPIEQRVTKQLDFSANGLPDQALDLEKTGIRFSESLPCPRITSYGADEKWTCQKDLSEAGPTDRVFSFDSSTRRIRFGNGINGLIPPAEATLWVEYEVTEGAAGNLPAGFGWTVTGLHDVFGTNLDPTTGGAAALDLAELRRRARKKAWKVDVIVTSADLEQAARALPDLRVARAQALDPPELGTHSSALSDIRTLVVLRARPPVEDSALPPESPRWLAEVRRQLVGRLPLGERLRVIAPDYVPLCVRATLLSRPGYNPEDIKKQALDVLKEYFTLVAGMPGDKAWPLGRQPKALDVKARLLKIDGVGGVKDCSLLEADPSAPIKLPELAKTTGLPLLRPAQCQIVVERLTRGVTS